MPTFSDLQNNEIFDYSLTLQLITNILESYYKVNSSTIIINEGEQTGQTIPHFHAHVIPRTKGDLTNNDLIYSNSRTFDDE